MIVEEIMNKEVITLKETNTIAEAIRLMEEQKIRHIPIIDADHLLIGLITDRDVRDATPSIFHIGEHLDVLEKPLSQFMVRDIVTGHPLDFVEEVSAVFYEHHIGCLPIVNENKLVGIITETDLLHTLVKLTGAHQPGSQIEVRVHNRAGMLFEVATVMRDRKVNIQSVLVYPDHEDDRFKILVLRVQTMNPSRIIDDLKQAGLQVLWPNLPGVSHE
ncbi:acetoin utilization AcuB family protein [Mesobacillus harenae]|uniref:acetoin utilization AcuB family protein n=1 Tax=Mesobacillus harenae TaxID=2213203 RepID=UPI00158033FF|nr:acetoin utilization AcuB family protein [Mesobacillus harenae]